MLDRKRLSHTSTTNGGDARVAEEEERWERNGS